MPSKENSLCIVLKCFAAGPSAVTELSLMRTALHHSSRPQAKGAIALGEVALATSAIRRGDFTGLAENYSKYRTGYAPSVLNAVLGLLRRPTSDLDAVDVGAGTGIWTRYLADAGFRSVTAVEPNDDMRNTGIRDSTGRPITWRQGTGEQTGLSDASTDLLCMASSFHWVDYDLGLSEFHRVLRPDGWFVALWSTRLLDRTPVLRELEDELSELQPDLRRSAFGPASRTDGLIERLADTPGFDDVRALEGRHLTLQSPDHYLGNWRSTNDIRHRVGEDKFTAFLHRAENRLAGLDTLEVSYATRSWAVRRK